MALTLSLAMWLVAFLAVGGEWFLMWQSHIWNGQEAAFRMFAVVELVLLIVLQPDVETQPCSSFSVGKSRSVYCGSADACMDFSGSPASRLKLHQHQRALHKRCVDEQRRAGERQAEVDVVQQEEGRERPEFVEREQERPEHEELFARARRMEEHRAKHKGADGNHDSGRRDEEQESLRGVRQCGEEVVDLRQIGESADVEGQVHQLQ